MTRPAAAPRAQRRRTDRVVAGVAGGIADHLGLPVLRVRAVFAVLAGFGGAGIVAYLLLWVFIPQGPAAGGSATRREQRQGAGLVVLGVFLAFAAGSLGGTAGAWVMVPIGVMLVGTAVVWREADESQRRRWREGARSGVAGLLFGGSGRSAAIRVGIGVVLVGAGIGVFLGHSGTTAGDLQLALLSVLATLVGVAVLTVPWWLRLVRDLNVERAERIRTQERTELAAHLHDSVLQTLALIQKQAGSEREVRRLARGQERELRNWLYGPNGYSRRSGTAGAGPLSTVPDGADAEAEADTEYARRNLSQVLAEVCGEVEDRFAITVQPVVVGEAELDAALSALIAAAREAIVNAAKHAGVQEVSVYGEAETTRVEVFVRDRGIGFEPEGVDGDRHGLADSIRGRMERNGGAVRLRTAPGEGTEVQLAMPRAPGTKQEVRQ